jgi:hypothetical protein
MNTGIGNQGLASAPKSMTEVQQSMNEASQINAVLLDRLNLLAEMLNPIRTPKPQNADKGKSDCMAQPCKLAGEIRGRAIEVAQAVNIVNLLLEEIEL